MVRLLSFLLGITCLFKASIAQSSSDENTDSNSSVCTPTTGLYAIYTSDSSTYLIQDAPRTGQAATSCPAEATSTVLEISTVWQTNDVSTVYRSSTFYVSNLSTIACGTSSSISGSLDCPPPATITIPAALPPGGINQTSVSTVFQEASCLSDASVPVTVTSLLSNNQPCPTYSSQSGADLYSWLLSNQSLSVSCSTIANISAAVTTTIFGTSVSSIIYGSAVCPIIFQSSPRTGFAASGLTTESSSPASISTIYQNASCQTVSTLPPVTTSVYLSNSNCTKSTVFSTIFESGSTEIISTISPVTTSIYLPNLNCTGSTVFSTVFQNGSAGSFTVFNSSCPVCPSSPFPGSTVFSTVFASGSAGIFSANNSSCPECPSSTCPGSTVFSTIIESISAGSLSFPNSSCPTCPTGGMTTVFANSASCTAPMNASTITLSQSFVSTVFTQDPACSSSNASSSMDMNSLISATRYTTIYGPDVTVTMPGQSFTTMDSDTYCDTCPDACYVDFNDDGIPDAQENQTSSASPSETGSNSTVVAPAPTPVVIADNNFENGTGNTLNSSSSSPAVTAQIVQSNDSSAPLTAQSGNSYLFLTFNDTSSPSKQQLFQRQSADQPLVYNASQSFASINGDTYNVSAYAQQAQNGANPPNCSITICVYNSCSAPALLETGTWQQYYYLYLATYDDDSAPATFSITCVGNAYVGLDSISVVDIPPPDTSTSAQPTDGSAPSASSNGAASDGSMSMTTPPGGSVKTVTRTIVRTRTTSAVVYASHRLPAREPLPQLRQQQLPRSSSPHQPPE